MHNLIRREPKFRGAGYRAIPGRIQAVVFQFFKVIRFAACRFIGHGRQFAAQLLKNKKGNLMGLRMGTLVLAISLINGGLAHAATLSNVDGMVLVDSGEGFRQVTGSVPLPLGSRVTARVGSSALVAYGDGCNVPVSPGAIVKVAPRSPCASLDGERQSLGGPDTTHQGQQNQWTTSTSTEGNLFSLPPPSSLIVGGTIVGGVVGGAVLANRQRTTGPVSP